MLPVGTALLVAGCASMPSSGEVRKVGEGQRADADSQVRVFGVPPRAGADPRQIVSGFLEATTSGEADFTTAKKYLSTATRKTWQPLAGITVYSGGLKTTEEQAGEDGETIDRSGTKAATVDLKHAYEPQSGEFQAPFHLVKEKNEWRIDGLDNGLVLSEQDFERLYQSTNMYYFAKLGSDAPSDGSGRQTLVADPVFLRNQADPLVSTVSALLGGPTTWLAHVTYNAVPSTVRLYDKAPDHGVTLDDSQHLRVRLDHAADKLPYASCVRLAAQIFATVQAQASAKLATVEVEQADGSAWCSLPQRIEEQDYASADLTGATSQPYYIAADGHGLLALADTTATAKPVPGPFGDSKADLGSVAVRRDEREAAGVRTNGRDLVVGSLVDDEPLGQPVLQSKAADPKKDGLSAPSWDGFDDLWVADRNPTDPRLLMLREGRGKPYEVSVPGLDGRVESLRVASDGVRIALVVRVGAFVTLELGRIERGTKQDPNAFTVTGLRDLTPVGENVTSVSWAGPSRLVVLDSVSGVQQIQYMNTDGSAPTVLPGINEASSVAASENQSKPLLASYNGRVYRVLPEELPEENWKQVSPKGGSPVYPG